MTMIYSNPARENDAHALPDVEVFYDDADDAGNGPRNFDGECRAVSRTDHSTRKRKRWLMRSSGVMTTMIETTKRTGCSMTHSMRAKWIEPCPMRVSIGAHAGGVNIMRIDTVKLSIVVAVVATAIILYCNPWTLFWYPPVTLATGSIIGGTLNALLTCVER